jgi:hypothetical protein
VRDLSDGRDQLRHHELSRRADGLSVTLEAIADGLWCVGADKRLGPGVTFPLRMTIARLPEGLWLCSPIALDDALVAEIDALGEVRSIVAPNGFHHLFAGHALARWPGATLFASAAIRRKRPDLPRAKWLEPGDATRWVPELDACRIDGMPRLDEWVFFHRPSRSLIATDLVFNIVEPRGLLTPLVLRIVGANRKLAQSRVFARLVAERDATTASLRRILAWEIERVVPAHGEIVRDDARARLRQVLGRWLADHT